MTATKKAPAKRGEPAVSAATFKSIPLKADKSIPKPVLEACKTLQERGHKAWLAGGCVRDMLLGRKARDWDVVTNAPLDEIRAAFPKHIEVGVAFGIIKLPPVESGSEQVQIDIAIFRREEGYSDLRHPDVVEPGDEHTDVARRDFTVNAMYFDPKSGQVLDYVGGYKDLQGKVLRTVGNPSTRFSEDALRLLRAVRFSAQLGFKITKETAAALKKCAPLLENISRERVREEVFRLFSTQKPVMGLEAIAQNGLWEQVFGIRRVGIPADLRQLKLSWTPTPLHWLAALGVTGLLGDPLTEPEAITQRLTDRLRLSNQEKRVFGRIVSVYQEAATEEHVSSPQDWVELARNDKALMDLTKSFIRRARGPSEQQKEQALSLIEQSLRWAAKPGSEAVWPAANDLMKKGSKPGPELGLRLKSLQWQSFWTSKPA